MTSIQASGLRTGARPLNASNRLGLDFADEAERLGPPPAPIVDVHSHINGTESAAIFRDVCDLFGVSQIYSMSRFEDVEGLRRIFGERIRFIAVPDYWNKENRLHNMTDGYVTRIGEWHAQGARIAKFWAAPRAIDFGRELGDPTMLRLDSPSKIRAMETAASLGMIFMAHIADPDTWFKTKYADASIYGTKAEQYVVFEELLERFSRPWIAAHMGGWPENLEFLRGLLSRHENLYLDTSACKWQVRELSKYPRDEIVSFLRQFRGRVLFGSDIVTTDDHLNVLEEETELQKKAANRDEAFDLYASRCWSFRTLFETDFDDQSPIADPDLAMVDPEKYDETDAPRLSGKSLPAELLREIYHDAAARLLNPLYAGTSAGGAVVEAESTPPLNRRAGPSHF